jgi:hypothetical protein
MLMLMQMQCNYGAKHLRCYSARGPAASVAQARGRPAHSQRGAAWPVVQASGQPGPACQWHKAEERLDRPVLTGSEVAGGEDGTGVFTSPSRVGLGMLRGLLWSQAMATT